MSLNAPPYAKISDFRQLFGAQLYHSGLRLLFSPFSHTLSITTQPIDNMPGISLADTISSLGVNDEWGPKTTTATTLDGVPYAPYSKSDKLGRMADWTQEGKEGRDRGGRQYGRNFRGRRYSSQASTCLPLTLI